MNGETAWTLYESRLRRVSAYIHEHLDEELDMERLAEIACMSSYHWHRIYRAIFGETLAATVKRLRLHRAAGDMVRTDLSVGEIAKRSGYPNLQSFNRIFKSVYGMPPGQYRKEGIHWAYFAGGACTIDSLSRPPRRKRALPAIVVMSLRTCR